jgi:hypothetical protein
MNQVFEPRMEVLPASQKLLWSALVPAAELGFVLDGGTAIALRLGHRTSVDFVFSDHPLNRAALKKSFPFLKGAVTLQDRADTWVMLAKADKAQGESDTS